MAVKWGIKERVNGSQYVRRAESYLRYYSFSYIINYSVSMIVYFIYFQGFEGMDRVVHFKAYRCFGVKRFWGLDFESNFLDP